MKKKNKSKVIAVGKHKLEDHLILVSKSQFQLFLSVQGTQNPQFIVFMALGLLPCAEHRVRHYTSN